MKKILFILGTKPEAIKLRPIIKKCKDSFVIKICLTNQHPNLEKILGEDCICLNLVRNEKGLAGLTGKILELLDDQKEIRKWKPDLVVVHGDTTSSLCGCLYAFYEKIKICHVESGLRTHDKYAPFPEEINRLIIDSISDINFCPTIENKKNLQKENAAGKIHVVGNTIIDVLRNNEIDNIKCSELEWANNFSFGIVTLHRRENWGEFIKKSIQIICDFAKKNKQKIIYVSNNNEDLRVAVKQTTHGNEFVLVCDPLDPIVFQKLLSECSFVITDSGGIQEEATYYQKPLIILRKNTERIEIIKNKCGILANNENLSEILSNFSDIKFEKNPFVFGNGTSSDKIVNVIKSYENILY